MCYQHHLISWELLCSWWRLTGLLILAFGFLCIETPCAHEWPTRAGWPLKETLVLLLFGRRATLKWTSNNQAKSKLSGEEWTLHSLFPKLKQSPCTILYKFPLAISVSPHPELRQDSFFQTYILATEEEYKRTIEPNCKICAAKTSSHVNQKIQKRSNQQVV